MNKRNLDQEILLFVYSDEEQGIGATDKASIIEKFKNYSRGYIHDRLMVLIKEGLLIGVKFSGQKTLPESEMFVCITDKGHDVAKKLILLQMSFEEMIKRTSSGGR